MASASTDDGWAHLPEPWPVVFEEAWESWRQGSAGVGAVVVDDAGRIVARGRNRIMQEQGSAGEIAGTLMAHAEMNVLVQLPWRRHQGHALFTTFEPCLMCASTILLYRMREVHYAAADPVFDGLHDWFASFPFSAERLPERHCLGGPIGAFGHVLHLSWLAVHAPPHVIDAHARLAPVHLEIARAVVEEEGLQRIADEGGSATDAFLALADRLEALAS